MAKINKRTVDAAETTGREHFVWDDALGGFGVRVSSKGKRAYVLQYRSGGRTRRITLGSATVLTATQARTKARKLLVEVSEGADPAAERQRQAQEPTVAELAERYLTDHAQRFKKADGAREDERALRKIVLPAIGKLRVSAVRYADLDKLHSSMRDRPIMANRVHGLCSKMFERAEAWEFRPRGSNPCRGIQRYRETPRRRDISLEELASIGKALRKLAEEGEDPAAIDALFCILLTGCRKTEITKLTWPEVNLEAGQLNLLDSKTGPKCVPLPDEAAAIIAKRERIGTLVFPSRRTGRALALYSPWERVRKMTGLKDVRMHDLRHAWGGIAASSGYGLAQIGAVLGQSTLSITEIYSHASQASAAETSSAVASKIHAALSDAANADVIPLRPSS